MNDNINFENQDFSRAPLQKDTYEECMFRSCNFNGANLSDIVFVDCQFENSNLSNAILNNTTIQACEFRHCKMIGVRFEQCNQVMISFAFENCMLNLASFYQVKAGGTRFMNCNLQEADFSYADLARSLFQGCDLFKAVFHQTILDKADLRTAENYSIDPENNYLKGTKVSASGLPGFMEKYGLEID